jgi:hypothetical protein
MRELLQATWRVFAVFLLALLLANILFPDNLYAKGFGSSRSYGSGSSPSSGDSSFEYFADPTRRAAPFRYRSYGNVPGAGRGPYVRDPLGSPFQAPSFVFAEEGDGRRRAVRPLLALTRDLRLLDGGGLAYHAPVAGHHFVLYPDRLDAMTNRGERLIALHPGPLADDAATALTAQAPLVTQAMDDHRRWVAWARWGSAFAPGRDARSEMDELERIQQAMDRARVQWSAPLRAPRFEPGRDLRPLVPGVFLTAASGAPEMVLVDSDGIPRRRSLETPRALTAMDRFVFAVLESGAAAGRDGSIAPIIQRWRLAHGTALDPPPGTPR